MTQWNIDLKQREVEVHIKGIKTKDHNRAEIIDQDGRQHQLSAIDFSTAEWNYIQKGNKITITVKESISRVIVEL